MTLLAPIIKELQKLSVAVTRKPSTWWGTVSATAPLKVVPDGATVAVEPQSLASSLAIGDRVLCIEQHRRVVVLGRLQS